MALIAPTNGRMTLAVMDLETRAAVRLTNLRSSTINRVVWASNLRLTFTTGDGQGIEFRGDGGMFGIDIDGANPRTLVSLPMVCCTSLA